VVNENVESLSHDGFPEPRKIFLGFLIQRIYDIQDKIYLCVPPSTHSIKAMMGLIDSLSSESKKALSKEYEELKEAWDKGDFVDSDLHRIFRNISTYLHETYLLEVHMAAPRFKADKPMRVESHELTG